jgi:uncharacterized cupin superfamily protein
MERKQFLSASMASLSFALFSKSSIANLAENKINNGAGDFKHKVILPGAAHQVQVPGLPTNFYFDKTEGPGKLSIVEHILEPGILGAPPHMHTHEDEYTFVLQGNLSLQLGKDVYTLAAGGFAFKPRKEIHTFWNSSNETVRLLEIIAPAGFENFFIDMEKIMASPTEEDIKNMDKKIESLGKKYGLTFFMDRIPGLIKKYNLKEM